MKILVTTQYLSTYEKPRYDPVFIHIRKLPLRPSVYPHMKTPVTTQCLSTYENSVFILDRNNATSTALCLFKIDS